MIKSNLLLGALYGAVGMGLRAILIVRSGEKIPMWYLLIDTVLCGALGALAFGVGIECGFGDWVSASFSGIAGSLGPHIVRYCELFIQKQLGISEPANKEDSEK